MGKDILEFYPLDIQYSTEENRAVIEIYGITEEGKRVIVKDDDFLPFFYLHNKDPKKALSGVKKLKEGDYYVVGAEITKKNYMGEEIDLIKISVNHPSGIQKIAKKCKEVGGYVRKFEKDIPFYKRYILEKNIQFFTRTRVEGHALSLNEPIIVRANKIENLNGDTIKDLKLIAFDIETYSRGNYSIPEKDPVIMISLYINGKTKILTTKKTEGKDVEVLKSEEDMIKRFIEIIDREKPHIITGYNIDLFDFPYLKERAKKYNMKLLLGWNRENMSKVRRGREYSPRIKGIISIDLYPFVRNILAPTLKTDVYNLNAVANEIIGEGKIKFDKGNMGELWDNGDVNKIVEYSRRDALITGKLAEALIFQIIELSKVVGLPPYDICRVSYSQYVEFYMMKKANERGEAIPNKPTKEEIEKRFRRTYTGAFVYEPVPGIYENIVSLDFRSLYPSIIISYNISPDTLNKGHDYESPEINGGRRYHFPKKPLGFFPSVLKNVLERRWTIKSMLKKTKKTEKSYKILDARQYALKTIANATYGYLGFPAARWYSIECAESITAWGRHHIKELIKDAEKKGFKVLYGDTDSVFFTVRKKHDYVEFLEEENKKMHGMIELEFSDFYKTGIFVSKKTERRGAKKKYALLNEEGFIEIKGLEYVRRDWSEIARECQKLVIETLLKEKNVEKARRIVEEIVKKLRKHEVPVEKTIIYTTLKKQIKDYKAIGPHVAAAKKAEAKGIKIFPGTILGYIIVEGEGSISDRAVLYEDVLEKGKKYDPEYYIKNQIIPAVEMILDIAGIESREERLEKFAGG